MIAPPKLLRARTWTAGESVPTAPALKRVCSGGANHQHVKVDRRAFRAALLRRRLNKDNLLQCAQIECTVPSDAGYRATLYHSLGVLLPEARIYQDRFTLRSLNLEAVAWLIDDGASIQPGAKGAEGTLASLEIQILSLSKRVNSTAEAAVDVEEVSPALESIKQSLKQFDPATLARQAQRLHARIKSLCAEMDEFLVAAGAESLRATHNSDGCVVESKSKGAKVFAMSMEQRQAAECPHSVFIQGRSGTGKTLVLVKRILRNYRKSQNACQVFITKSSLLRADVMKELTHAGCENTAVLELARAPGGVVCLTWEDLVRGLHGRNATIDYQRFQETYWPRIKAHANQLPVLLVWAEFNTRLRTFQCASPLGISIDEYLKDDLAAVGVRLERRDQLALYKAFSEYTRLKKVVDFGGHLDDVDVALQLRAIVQIEAFVDALFVDEAQDFSPAQLMLMLSFCKNPDGVTVAGDTCQTINPGSAFSFREIVEAFHIHADSVGEEFSQRARQCQMLTLSYNYRCSAGVVSLANSVTRLLFARFPTCADPIEEETVFRGTCQIPLVVCVQNTSPADCIMGRGYGSVPVVDAARIAIIVRSNAQRSLLRRQGVKGDRKSVV